jgi:hypothetical protein
LHFSTLQTVVPDESYVHSPHADGQATQDESAEFIAYAAMHLLELHLACETPATPAEV